MCWVDRVLLIFNRGPLHIPYVASLRLEKVERRKLKVATDATNALRSSLRETLFLITSTPPADC